MRAAWWIAAALVGLVPSACGSSKATSPPLAGTGGSRTIGTAQSGGGDDNAAGVGPTSASGAGQVAQGGEGDLPPIGSISGAPPAAEDGGAPASIAPVCAPDTTWGGPSSLAGVNTADADERLLTMTHDELTLVFSRGDQLFVVDRTAASAAFGAPSEVTLPVGYSAAQGLAVTPDGLSLVAVQTPGYAFADITRATRSGAFDSDAKTDRFARINDARSFSGALLASPVLAANGTDFFFTQRSANDSYVWLARGTTVFDNAVKQDVVTLGATDGKAKLTVSVAADERALFVFDEALGHASGLWTQTAGTAFTELVQFPGLDSVFTNQGCSRLYGTAEVAGSLDVVIEAPK